MTSPVTISILGGLVILAAVIVVVLAIRSLSRTRNVRKHGRLISATVTKVDAEIMRQGRERAAAYYVYAAWVDPRTHRTYHFKSEAGGISLALRYPPDSPIDVLIDPANPERYEVVLKLNERSYI